MGYSLDIFQSKEAAESYICMICLGVVENPMLVGDCEHFVCANCLRGIRQCPNKCRAPFAPRNPNPGFLRLYNALKLTCYLCDDWKVNLGDLSTHHNKDCMLFPIQCSHRGCNKKQPRQNMNAIHSQLCSQRILPCQYCGERFSCGVLKAHFETCGNYPIKCTNQGCDAILPRNQTSAHQNKDCMFTVVECEWRDFGCDYKAIRKDIQNHHLDSTVKHLACVKSVITKILSVLPQDKAKRALFDWSKNENAPKTQQGVSLTLPSSSSSTTTTQSTSTIPSTAITTESFEVHSNDITDEQLLEQLPPQHNNKLKSLNLNDCFKLTDQSITQIAPNCTRLQYLDLRGCQQLTDTSIIKITENCKQLRVLSLSDCNQITDECVIEVVKNCIELHTLYLNNCHNVSKALRAELQSLAITTSLLL